jgi:ABC-2 type transport system permease protein
MSRRTESVARSGQILLASARMQMLVVRNHPMIVLSTVVQPTALLLLVSARQGTSAGTVLSVVLTSLWGATLWAAGGTLRREVADGTLVRNLTTVSDPRLVVIGKCFGSTLLTVGLLSGTATAMMVVTGASLSPRGAVWLLMGGVLVVASGTAMGTVLSSLFVLTRHATHVTAALMFPVFILGGLLVPTTMIPGPLRRLSWLISLYWANQLFGAATVGELAVGPLLFLALVTVGYFWLGGLLFSRVVDRARRKGTIDLG